MLSRQPTDHQREGFSHRCKIGGNVDGVGRDKQCHQHHDDGTRIELFDIGYDAFAGDPSYMRTDQLNGDHERRGEKHCPQQSVGEMRSRLRIGRNS